MCGVIGISSSARQYLADGIFEGVQSLTHRGADGAGMVLSQGGRWVVSKTMGPASNLLPFIQEQAEGAEGRPEAGAAVGHVRYATHGGVSPSLVQPITLEDQTALAFNGHLRTSGESDSQWFARELNGRMVSLLRKEKEALKWLSDVGHRMQGAASGFCLAGDCLLIFRDITGIRPLVVGIAESGSPCVIAASETVAIYSAAKAMGFQAEDFRTQVVPPGTCWFAKGGELVQLSAGDDGFLDREASVGLCAMEPIYMSDPQSQFASSTIYEWRRETGRLLAGIAKIQADVVVGVPSSGIAAAVGLGEALGLPVAQGLTRRRQSRSFLQSTAAKRKRCADEKFIVHSNQLVGRRVLLVDDSLVRGTTMKSLVDRVRQAGAVEVHVVIASPPVQGICTKGIDLKTKRELFAQTVAEENRAKAIGADSLTYADQSMINRLEKPMCMKCFRA